MTITIETIEPGVQRLRCRTWRGAAVGYDSSAYLLHGVLVDTAFARVGADLLRAVSALSPRGSVVTHSHEDHSGNVAPLAARGLPIAIAAGCEAILRTRPSIGPYRSLIWGRPARLDAPILPFDPAPLVLFTTPGHTPDHQVLWDAERRILASGDLYLGVKVRVAHRHESPKLLLESLRRMAALDPRLLLDAHRGPLQDATAHLRAKISWMEETIGAIIALASAGVGEHEIRRRLLGVEDGVGLVSFGEYSKRSFVRTVLDDFGATSRQP